MPFSVCLCREMVQADGPQDYIKALGKHRGVNLVVCVVPNSRLDRYVAIKRHVCMVMAAPSQVGEISSVDGGVNGGDSEC